MKTNKIPTPYPKVINLAGDTLLGATNSGAGIGLEHNTAPVIATDFYDLIGDPATPLVPGKESKYRAQLVVQKAATALKQTQRKAGRDFCLLAISLLKPVLGSRWNTSWQAAGFATPSLAVPAHPSAMLVQLRAYFAAHAAHENVTLNVTAAQAQLLADQIHAANIAQGEAKALRGTLKLERDAAFRALRRRLSGLRAELAQLLSPTDQRWYQFGFVRPADGHMPSPVTELVLTAGGPGIVLAAWSPSSLAENYRVTWQHAEGTAEPTEVGLFTEPQTALSLLPSGTSIIVGVSARNDSGETEPAEGTIVVP